MPGINTPSFPLAGCTVRPEFSSDFTSARTGVLLPFLEVGIPICPYDFDEM
jgi:hypothetical protein